MYFWFQKFDLNWPFQVKRPLRPLQQQLPPPSLAASRTTALPGRSTTASRLLTTAQPTLRQWVEHHKPLRYTPDENLPCTSTEYPIILCLNSLPSSGFTGPQWLKQLHTLNLNYFLPKRFLAFYFGKLSQLILLLTCNVSSMYFFCTGPVMWRGHKVNATLSKQNPLLMFGCSRLDEDLKFPWFESGSHRWQITRRTRPLLLLFFCCKCFVFSEVIIHMVIPALYLH